MEISEQERIQQCQQGDLSAFGFLYDIYIDRIYNFIFYKVSHKQTAEDLTSQAFFKAMQHINKYSSEKGSFSSWLYRIARNTVIDHYRTSKSTEDLEQAWNVSNKENISENIDIGKNLEIVYEYLETLKPEHREIVVMRLWDELSYKEIADITGKTEANCKVTFSRVMTKLRKEIGPIALYLFLLLTTTIYGKIY